MSMQGKGKRFKRSGATQFGVTISERITWKYLAGTSRCLLFAYVKGLSGYDVEASHIYDVVSRSKIRSLLVLPDPWVV